jgi:pimeloyl-ACP methyl ester carboxylesterase
VLHGEYDPLIPVENGQRFAQAIPGARLIRYPEVGHLPQREIPERSAADLEKFLRALPPA